MNQPEQQQIDHWFAFAKKWIPRKKQKIASGEGKQATYTSLALAHASFARAKFLNGDALTEVRTEFANAARCILKNFTMAYDEADPDYLGDQWPERNPHYTGLKGSPVTAKWCNPTHGQLDLSELIETYAIDGINYALIAADFELAAELAQIYRTSPDGDMLDIDVNRYVHTLKQWLLGEPEAALSLIHEQFEDYKQTPPKSAGDKNYYTLFTTLFGIVSGDNAVFNEGLQQQLVFYQSYAQGEAKNTTEEFICDPAVALANLGFHRGLTVTVTHDTLPPGLLLIRSK